MQRQAGGRAVNKHLDEAITRVRNLSDEQQRVAAEILLDFVEQEQADIHLTPDQIAEIERRLSDDEPYASDEEVRATFDRLTK
jgi:hypothetical protein